MQVIKRMPKERSIQNIISVELEKTTKTKEGFLNLKLYAQNILHTG